MFEVDLWTQSSNIIIYTDPTLPMIQVFKERIRDQELAASINQHQRITVFWVAFHYSISESVRCYCMQQRREDGMSEVSACSQGGGRCYP